jgi:hypothetical protein
MACAKLQLINFKFPGFEALVKPSCMNGSDYSVLIHYDQTCCLIIRLGSSSANEIDSKLASLPLTEPVVH